MVEAVKVSEAQITKMILLRASELGHRLFRNNTGALKNDRGEWVKYGVGGNGGSDIIGWTKDGIFAAIEVKTPTGKPSAEQEAFIRSVKASGGKAGIARSVGDAEAILA